MHHAGCTAGDDERRRKPRVMVEYKAAIHGPRCRAADVVSVADLSATGVRFRCGERIEPGTGVLLVLMPVDDRRRLPLLAGTVVRCTGGGDASDYSVACQFD